MSTTRRLAVGAVGSTVTNAEGQATAVYTATNTASATNGVVITGTVANTAITAQTTLTVGGQAVFLSLGTGNTIAIYSPTQFLMPFSIQAVDASGNPVPNLAITFAVRSLGYAKGEWISGSPWTQNISTLASDPDLFTLSGVHGCQTEDTNGNGVLDAGEDYNGNGVLDPGSVANTATLAGTLAASAQPVQHHRSRWHGGRQHSLSPGSCRMGCSRSYRLGNRAGHPEQHVYQVLAAHAGG